jgi:hypothetical protein
MVSQVLRDSKVLMDLKEIKVILVSQVLKDSKDTPDLKVILVS